MRLAARVSLALLVVFAAYEAVTFVEVWQASRRDEAQPVQAIVVFGAAQYDGRPSPVLQARLDHAAQLWNQNLAQFVVVTGGRQPGDRFTEATAAARYLSASGIPNNAILREVSGRNSWDSLAAAVSFLRQRGIDQVLLVSDPFHSARIAAMASELGLEASTSPTRTSPIEGIKELEHFGRETVAVSIGRVIGYRKLMRVNRAVERARMPEHD